MTGALAGLRVLVVEDEFLVADMLADALEDAGVVVAGVAGSLAEALAMVEGTRPDLAVIDWNLGGDRSDPVARRLIARGVPFVISTGYGAVAEEFAAIPLISKPYEPASLISALENLAGTGRSAA
jgi:CheY-like chemotaxis protein